LEADISLGGNWILLSREVEKFDEIGLEYRALNYFNMLPEHVTSEIFWTHLEAGNLIDYVIGKEVE
jgi:hypothetical protein